MNCFFPTSLCGVLVFWLPSRPTPSFPPSFPPPSFSPPSFSYTHTIILSSDLFPSHTIISSSHTHTLILSSHISHSHTQSSHHLTHTLILSSSHLFLSFLSLSFILFHSLSSPLDLLALLVISQSHTQSSSRPHPLTTSSIRPSCHISHPQWPA